MHCLYHGAPQAVNNMHCGAVQTAAPQFRGDPEQRRSSGGGVASIGLAHTPSLRVPAPVSCAINCFVIHAQRVNVRNMTIVCFYYTSLRKDITQHVMNVYALLLPQICTRADLNL